MGVGVTGEGSVVWGWTNLGGEEGRWASVWVVDVELGGVREEGVGHRSPLVEGG